MKESQPLVAWSRICSIFSRLRSHLPPTSIITDGRWEGTSSDKTRHKNATENYLLKFIEMFEKITFFSIRENFYPSQKALPLPRESNLCVEREFSLRLLSHKQHNNHVHNQHHQSFIHLLIRCLIITDPLWIDFWIDFSDPLPGVRKK